MRRAEFVAGAGAVLVSSAAQRLQIAAAPLAHDIDPYTDAERGADELAWLYADGLVGWSGDELVPVLALRLPEVADGGLTYRYELRHASWHDGLALRARHVAEALAAVRASAWSSYEPYRSVRDLTVRGDRRFDVHLHAPRAGFVRSFFGPYGVPALPLVRHAADGTPLGTGPFAIAARPERERWVLRRWDGSPRGTPRQAELGVRLILSEPTASVQLRSGEAHIALPLTPDAIGGAYARILRPTSTAVLLFNRQGALGTAAARRAFAAAVDVPRLQRLYDRRRVGLFASLLMQGGNDLACARSLRYEPAALATLRDQVGTREVRLVYVAESPSHQRTMTSLQQSLRSGGVSAVLGPVPGEHYYDPARPVRSGAYDVCLIGFPYVEAADAAADWSCADVPPAGGNFARWCDPVTEAALRGGDARRLLRRLYDEMACIPLGRAREAIGVSARVGGFSAPKLLAPATYGCAAWWLR